MPANRAPHRGKSVGEDQSSFSSENEDATEVYDSEVRRSLNYSSATPKGSFRYIALRGESDSESDEGEEELPPDVSGIINREKNTSTPKATSQSQKRISFNTENGEPSAIKSRFNRNDKGKENLPARASEGGRFSRPALQPVRHSLPSPAKSRGRKTAVREPSVDREASQRKRLTKETKSNQRATRLEGPDSSPRRRQSKITDARQELASKPRSPQRNPRLDGISPSTHRSRTSTVSDAEQESRVRQKSSSRASSSGDTGLVHPAVTRGIPQNQQVQHIERNAAPSVNRRTSDTASLNRRKATKPRKNKTMSIIKQIQALQRGTDLLIRRAPFQRVVREVTASITSNALRWSPVALQAIHEATEATLITMFEKSNLCCLHARRVTLKPEDMQLVMRILDGNI